jgi:hypothetical protein
MVVTRCENDEGIRAASLMKIQRAFEGAGIVFLNEEGGLGPGIRLAEAPPLAFSKKATRDK